MSFIIYFVCVIAIINIYGYISTKNLINSEDNPFKEIDSLINLKIKNGRTYIQAVSEIFFMREGRAISDKFYQEEFMDRVFSGELVNMALDKLSPTQRND